MARVFLRLKLRLLGNSLRSRGWRVVGFVLGAIYGLGVALLGFVSLAVGRGRADGDVIAVLVGSALALGWAVLPVVGYGSDETLDPMRLALLPLRRGQLVGGLLVASLAGIGGVATIIALSGGIIGFAPGGPGAVLVIAALVAQLILCVALGRAVITALSATLRSRRGRDVRVIFVALLAFAPQLLRFVRLPKHGTSLGRFRHLTNILGWLPTGWAMRSVVASSHHHWAVAASWLVAVMASTGALLWWWARTLGRLFTTAEASGGRARRAEVSPRAPWNPSAPSPLFGRALAWLPRTRLGAVAAREVRSNWREPRRRVQVLSGFLLPFIVLAGVLARGGFAHRPKLVLASLLVIALGGNRVYNQIGLDGPAWWVHESAGSDLTADLSGKNVAFLLTTMPAVLVTATILAALTRGWAELLLTLPLAFAVSGVQLAIGNVLSVQAPWGVPSTTTNLWATNSGQGCLVGLLGLAGLAVQAVIAAPFAVALALSHGWAPQVLVVVTALGTGFALWRLGTWIALRAGAARGPELLATVSGTA